MAGFNGVREAPAHSQTLGEREKEISCVESCHTPAILPWGTFALGP